MGATSQHFSDSELRCHGPQLDRTTGKRVGCQDCLAGKTPKNECTQKLVDGLEQVRSEAQKYAGAPVAVIVDSAYRCPERNKATTNAAKNSQHQLGEAADIKIKVLGLHGVYWLSAAEMEQIALRCLLITGIGRDDHAGYVHVDVRTDRTHAAPARWCYEPSGQSCAWYPPRVDAVTS